MEVTPEAMARYAAELERDLATTVWTNGCRSYFHNPSGDIVTQLPHTSGWYRDATASIDEADFTFGRGARSGVAAGGYTAARRRIAVAMSARSGSQACSRSGE